MSNKTKFLCLFSCLVIVSIIPILMFISTLDSQSASIKDYLILKENKSARFKVIDEVIFYRNINGIDVPALILRDKETNIDYIFVLSHNGPTLTRLWEK
jgi:hypothetical protein